MSGFRRDPEKYPYLNGVWLDRFAQNLLRKQALDSSKQFSKEEEVGREGGILNPVNQESNINISQLAQEVANEVIVGGQPFDQVISKYKSIPDYNLISEPQWGQIRSESANLVNESLIDVGSASKSFYRYIQHNRIQQPTVSDFEKYYKTIMGEKPTFEERVIQKIVTNTKGYTNETDINELVSTAMGIYLKELSEGNNPDVYAIISNVSKENSLNQVQEQQLRNSVVNQVNTLSQNSNAQKNIVESVQESLKIKAFNFGDEDEVTVTQAINNTIKNEDNNYVQQIKPLVLEAYRAKLEELKNKAETFLSQARNIGKAAIDLASKDPELSANTTYLKIVSKYIKSLKNFQGQFSVNNFEADLQEVQQEIEANLLDVEGLSNMATNALKGKSDINREQLNSIITSLNSFYNSLFAMNKMLVSTINNIKPAPLTANSQNKIVVAGLFDFFKKKKEESDPDVYNELINKTTELMYRTAFGLTRLNNLNKMVQLPDAPDYYKNLFQNIISNFGNIQQNINNVAKSLGIENPPSIASVQNIVSNAQQAVQQGAQTVDAFTGKPGAGQGPQVPPEELVQDLTGQQTGQQGQGKGGKQSRGGGVGQQGQQMGMDIPQTLYYLKQLIPTVENENKRNRLMELLSQMEIAYNEQEPEVSQIQEQGVGKQTQTASFSKRWFKV